MSVDWDSKLWGQVGTNVHLGLTVDDAHTASEESAEAAR